MLSVILPFLDRSCNITAAKTKAPILTRIADNFKALVKCIKEYSTCAQYIASDRILTQNGYTGKNANVFSYV